MYKVVLIVVTFMLSLSGYAGFYVHNDSSSITKDGAQNFATTLDDELGLSGSIFNAGNQPLTPVIPMNGQRPPLPEDYKNKKITVHTKMNEKRPGIDKRDYYQITIDGLSGSYLVPESALNGLSTYQSAKNSNVGIGLFNQYVLGANVNCDQRPTSGTAGPSVDGPSLEMQRAYQDKLRQQIKERNDIEDNRYVSRTRNGYRSERRYQGNAPFAGGETTAVADGTGLINFKASDPGADNATQGCEPLTASEDDQRAREDMRFTTENLKECINNIQKYILQDIAPRNARSSDRETVFQRLFELPNHEQEFAAAIFTLTGEIGGIAKERPMEGMMILKVMENRRNNANGIEDELAKCKSSYGSDSGEMALCYARANEKTTYNLLDIALDNKQFSMYNAYDGANWTKNMGRSNPGQFDTALDVLTNYQNIKEWTMKGKTNDVSDPDLNKIYHYHTPAVHPDWRRDNQMLEISGVTHDGKELEKTKSHVFYYNLGIGGKHDGDGWKRNVKHEFRKFP